ncbi:MAG: hypothetical protein WCI43_04515, partial [Candidatus Firestonebacteria bacterium]
MRKYSLTFTLLSLAALLFAPGCSKKVPGIFSYEDFAKKTITLDSQAVSAIEKAYSRLPARGTLTVKTDELRISGVASRLEKLGFMGLTLDFSEKKIFITCYKGKTGPAYETGRSAKLKSTLLAAVIDDDNRLLFNSTAVSEKTAQIYMAGLYKDYVEVSEPSAELFSKLQSAPDLFDSDRQEAAAEELKKSLLPGKEKPEAAVVYMGPFKILILRNGTMIRRCQPVLLSKETARLLEGENCRPI